jgi:hypothetical protein
MGAVWYRARAELRRRWRSTLVLALLAGLTGGVVLASVAGARRTSTAMDRFVEFNRPGTLFLGSSSGGLDVEAIRALPEVVSTSRGSYVLMAPAGPDGERTGDEAGAINPFLVIPDSGEESNRPLIVDGSRPDPDDPLATMVDEETAEVRGLEPGDTLRMYGYDPEQLFEANISRGDPPEGPAMDFVVSGVFRTPNDVVPRPSPPDVIYTSSKDMILGRAWYERFGGQVSMFTSQDGSLDMELRLREGADPEAVEARIKALAGSEALLVDASSESSMAREASDRTIRFSVLAILAFAALVAATGVALVGQALARSLALEAEDGPVLRALGLGPWSLTAVTALRSAAVGLPAAVLAIGVAVALSPVFPVGLARQAEIDPGIHVDAPTLAIGALAVAAVVVARGALTGVRLARGATGLRPVRPSRVAGRLADAGAPPPLVAGARLALGPGRGRGALVGLGLAVVVVVAAATFARSLDHLVATPSLQGWNWDAVVGNGQEESIEDEGELLETNPLVDGWSGRMEPFAAQVDGKDVDLEIIGRGDGPTAAASEGRAPSRAGEVALGEETLDEVGAGIGDRVELAFDTVTDVGQEIRGGGTSTVVGTVLFNDAEEQQTELGQGALVTLDGLEALGGQPVVSRFLVDYAEGVDEDEAYRSLQADFGRTVLRPVNAVDVENLRRVSGVPVMLAALVGALALAVLAHALVTTLHRRRRDLAVLRTLGFLRRQLGAAVLAFAGTTVVLAVVVGAPLGIGVGRWSWQLVADSLGTPAAPVVPPVVVALIAPVTLLVAAAVAAGPARAAAETRPALVLRSE